jgi:hypothetical protein
MPTIRFESTLIKIGSLTILTLPTDASAKLPSRGMNMIEGTINNFHFQTALEPDGKGSHWFRVDEAMRKAAGVDVGDAASIAIEPSGKWPEPKVPADLKHAFAALPQGLALWMDITAAARWDWIRWIGATKNPETRKRRIAIACSKLTDGKRRPCCFNRTQCTEPEVSNNGILLNPAQTDAKKLKLK